MVGVNPFEEVKDDKFKDVWLVLKDNVVVNVIVWDGILYDPETAPTGWQPPEGVTLMPCPNFYDADDMDDIIEPGCTFDEKTNVFTRPEPTEPPVIDTKPITQADKLAQLLIDKKLITKEDVSDLGISVSSIEV